MRTGKKTNQLELTKLRCSCFCFCICSSRSRSIRKFRATANIGALFGADSTYKITIRPLPVTCYCNNVQGAPKNGLFLRVNNF